MKWITISKYISHPSFLSIGDRRDPQLITIYNDFHGRGRELRIMDPIRMDITPVSHDATNIVFATGVVAEDGIELESNNWIEWIIHEALDCEASIHAVADLADSMLSEGEVVPIH